MADKDVKNFNTRVYEIAALIPRGKVATYGQIAMMLGYPRGGIMVGRAMSKAPAHLRLPCHRVVNRTGRLAPPEVFGSEDVQRAMLEAEGITFRPDGTIDMARHIWTVSGGRFS